MYLQFVIFVNCGHPMTLRYFGRMFCGLKYSKAELFGRRDPSTSCVNQIHYSTKRTSHLQSNRGVAEFNVNMLFCFMATCHNWGKLREFCALPEDPEHPELEHSWVTAAKQWHQVREYGDFKLAQVLEQPGISLDLNYLLISGGNNFFKLVIQVLAKPFAQKKFTIQIKIK